MALLQRQAGFSLSRLLFGMPLTTTPRTTPLLPAITLPTLTIVLPGFLSDIWEGILRAVPKKKTSHSKVRSRLYAGKALKHVKGLNTCPGCGRTKKSHHICPFCWSDMVVRFNKIKKDLNSKVMSFKNWKPPTMPSKREMKMRDKFLGVEARLMGKEPDEHRAEVAEQDRAKLAAEVAERKRITATKRAAEREARQTKSSTADTT